MSEAQLQHHCYYWFSKTYPHDRKYLWLQHNNPRSAVEGAKLIGMGLQKGVSDMCYLAKGNFPYFLELKIEKGKQSAEQIAWQRAVEERGAVYAIIRSVNDFKFWVHTAQLHSVHYRTALAYLIAQSEMHAIDYKQMEHLQYHLWHAFPKHEIPEDLKDYIINLNLKLA